MNLRHIYYDHANIDVTFLKFQDFCADCCRNKHSFAVVAKDTVLHQGRYRKGFDMYIR